MTLAVDRSTLKEQQNAPGSTFKRVENPTVVLEQLHLLFGQNLATSRSSCGEALKRVDVKARAVAYTRDLLQHRQHISKTQAEIVQLFDEVFADLTVSVYLAATAMDRPSQMVLRRGFELGVAAVYLWDLPHEYWGWRELDKDLNFNDMIDHINSEGFREYVARETGCQRSSTLVDAQAAHSIYRNLSNTVHGKLSSFESNLPDRFKHTPTDWEKHVATVEQVEDLLIGLWEARFPDLREKLQTELPSFTMARMENRSVRN